MRAMHRIAVLLKRGLREQHTLVRAFPVTWDSEEARPLSEQSQLLPDHRNSTCVPLEAFISAHRQS